jgi:hypothetical protein
MKLAVKMGNQQLLILVLALISAGIHLAVFFTDFNPIMLLNSLGYVGLLALYFISFSFLPINRNWVRWALIGYTALTIIIYVVLQVQSGGQFVSPLGIFDKIIELVLIYLLWRDT